MRPTDASRRASEAFLQAWLPLMRSLLHQLIHLPREPVHAVEHRAAVADAVNLYASFFRARSRLALRDPAAALCPPWAGLLARALLWMGGWRPTAALRLVPDAASLSVEQASGVEAISAVTRAEVAAVEEEIGWLQTEGVARLATAVDQKAAVGRVVARQRRVAVAAESLRMEVVRRVVEVLAPLQAVDFLAAVMRLEISLHET
ncbi:hypothetical protein Cni_G11504 [Canna indica]|uniref:DOG1 domain-containing protein n=1 Tax=Canna indica TaxID=4628 RepID=A0AAQ3K6G9_9LILI|nr:hypothetical protein Cni_G11504 [Canna indica]